LKLAQNVGSMLGNDLYDLGGNLDFLGLNV